MACAMTLVLIHKKKYMKKNLKHAIACRNVVLMYIIGKYVFNVHPQGANVCVCEREI